MHIYVAAYFLLEAHSEGFGLGNHEVSGPLSKNTKVLKLFLAAGFCTPFALLQYWWCFVVEWPVIPIFNAVSEDTDPERITGLLSWIILLEYVLVSSYLYHSFLGFAPSLVGHLYLLASCLSERDPRPSWLISFMPCSPFELTMALLSNTNVIKYSIWTPPSSFVFYRMKPLYSNKPMMEVADNSFHNV